MKTRLLFTHVLSPLHAGTGQGVGVIDLPIAREKATGLPFLPGSSVKGTLRDICPATYQINGRTINRTDVFGPEKNRAEEHASSAQFSDQRLLLLPVRSLRGTFAWVTSPYILQRLMRDARDIHDGNSLSTLAVPRPTSTATREECLITSSSELAEDGTVYLEDLDLTAATDTSKQGEIDGWADALAQRIFPAATDMEWRQFFAGRFCIVSDDVMNFLMETATEITARIALDKDAKTVAEGALWYEEALPCETVLFGLALAAPIKAAPEDSFTVIEGLIKDNPVQFGGKATVGRGLCRLTLS